MLKRFVQNQLKFHGIQNNNKLKMSSEKQISKSSYSKWDEEMIDNLIGCIISYKAEQTFKGIDFDGDKSSQYKNIRIALAKIYCDPGPDKAFGPVSAYELPVNFEELCTVEQKLVKAEIKLSKKLSLKHIKE